MLQQVDSRRISLGLSVRQFARQLSVTPSLLSMVLNRHCSQWEIHQYLAEVAANPGWRYFMSSPTRLLHRFIADRMSWCRASIGTLALWSSGAGSPIWI